MPDFDDVQDGKDYHIGGPMHANVFFLKGSNSLDWGMKNRLARIFNPATGRTVMLAVDHGYFQGPTTGLERIDVSIVPLVPYADALMITRGALRTCIRELVDHYEQEGRLMWHMLRQEQDVPLLQDALPEARAVHRRWVETVFAAELEPRDARQRRARIDALVAATDLFVWKLLRIDLGRSRVEVEAAMLALAGGS